MPAESADDTNGLSIQITRSKNRLKISLRQTTRTKNIRIRCRIRRMRLDETFPDPSKAFVVVKMLKGYGKLGARLYNRLPITVSILHKLLQSATLLSCFLYQVLLFQTV